jgi:hypothetical protein
MNPKNQFANLEIMSRERAALAKKEAEHWLAEAAYWSAEAEEWKQLRESSKPFEEGIAKRSSDLAESNNA